MEADMGHRANLVIVRRGGYDLYYSHWAANTLPRDLFWGPTHALTFVRLQRPTGEDGWLDNVWAEGGAIIDPDARVLRLFGGENIQYDVPLRRLYLTLLATVWDGWDVGWAHEGIADLADYVGYPRDRVITHKSDTVGTANLSSPTERDWVDLVGAVRLIGGGIRLFPLAGDAIDYLLTGPALADAAVVNAAHDYLCLSDWTTSFPTSGFHVDVAARSVRFWSARDEPGETNRVSARWPNWSVIWDRDRYEAQLDAAGGLLSFPERPAETLLNELVAILLYEPGKSPAETVLWLVEEERQAGKSVEVNPFALRDDRLDLSRETRAEILTRAVARLGLRLPKLNSHE
jgi:hypothetical protein